MILRISAGKAKNGITRSQFRCQSAPMVGYFPFQRLANSAKAAEPPFVIAHDLRLEGAIAVPRYLDHCFAEIAFQSLRTSAIARVPAAAPRRVVLAVTQVAR